jgi:uncharacterized short protein YbdD (DUF466 family)
MKSAIIFLITMAILFIVVYNYIKAIDHMKENHPDYKGEDLFNENVDTM